MPDETEKFWSEMARKLSRAMDLHPLCPKESEQEYFAAEERDLPQDKLDEMLESVVSGRDDWNQPPDSPQWLESGEAVHDREFQFNRNLGEEDPEVDKRVDELRRKELGTDDDTKHKNGLDGKNGPEGEGGQAG